MNLGRKTMGLGMLMPPMKMEDDMEEEEHYPSLYIEGDKDYGLPDSGVMTVRFKKCCETNTKTEDSLRQAVTLDIVEIMDVKETKSDKEKPSREDELDKLKAEVESENMGGEMEDDD